VTLAVGPLEDVTIGDEKRRIKTSKGQIGVGEGEKEEEEARPRLIQLFSCCVSHFVPSYPPTVDFPCVRCEGEKTIQPAMTE
jgi:hypothetical protein